MRHTHGTMALLSTIGVLALAATVHADAVLASRCRQAINKEFGTFVKKKSRILRTCKDHAVTAANPASPVDCPLTPQDDAINAAAQRMKDKIALACGGANAICNAADVNADADVPLADIGWAVGLCPDLRGQGCVNPIADCADIGTCLACIGHEAVNQATDLSYDLLSPAEFGTGSALNVCQATIGKAIGKFLETRSKLLHGCWGNVLKAKAGFTSPPGCPATDPTVPNRTIAKLVAAEQKAIAQACTACGAGGDADADLVCDQPTQAFSPAAIGFEPDCPDVTVPSTGVACGRAITNLADLLACVDCVTRFETDCTTALAVPTATTYPAECVATP